MRSKSDDKPKLIHFSLPVEHTDRSRDRGDQQVRSEAVREPRLRSCQASLSLLPERRGRASAEVVA